MALRNFIQSGPTWIALKGFIWNKFVPARDPKLQQMEALNEKPLPGETITTYTNRWFNEINHTWVEQLREAGHVELLVRALILNCTSTYHLITTPVSLRVFSIRSRPSSSNLPGHNFQIPSLPMFIVPESLSTNRVAVISNGATDTLLGFVIAYTWAPPPNLVLPTLHLMVTALLMPPPNMAPLTSPPVETSPEENVYEVPPAASRTTTPWPPPLPLEIGDDGQLSNPRQLQLQKMRRGRPCRVRF
jgi:hypothetical protein